MKLISKKKLPVEYQEDSIRSFHVPEPTNFYPRLLQTPSVNINQIDTSIGKFPGRIEYFNLQVDFGFRMELGLKIERVQFGNLICYGVTPIEERHELSAFDFEMHYTYECMVDWFEYDSVAIQNSVTNINVYGNTI